MTCDLSAVLSLESLQPQATQVTQQVTQQVQVWWCGRLT